jgi:hypothetical protein
MAVSNSLASGDGAISALLERDRDTSITPERRDRNAPDQALAPLAGDPRCRSARARGSAARARGRHWPAWRVGVHNKRQGKARLGGPCWFLICVCVCVVRVIPRQEGGVSCTHASGCWSSQLWFSRCPRSTGRARRRRRPGRRVEVEPCFKGPAQAGPPRSRPAQPPREANAFCLRRRDSPSARKARRPRRKLPQHRLRGQRGGGPRRGRTALLPGD